MYPLDRGGPSQANLLYSQPVLLATLEFKSLLVLQFDPNMSPDIRGH